MMLRPELSVGDEAIGVMRFGAAGAGVVFSDVVRTSRNGSPRGVVATRIEPVGGSSIKARFMKPGKYSHVTWLGGNKAKY